MKTIYSNSSAFAALKEDGSSSLGEMRTGRSGFESVADQLKSGVKVIYSTDSAFAAMKEDGSIVTWGISLVEEIRVRLPVS